MLDFLDRVLIPFALRDIGPWPERLIPPGAKSQKGDFGRKIAEARNVKGVEILELVRSYG
jgi:hypothetical protein